MRVRGVGSSITETLIVLRAQTGLGELHCPEHHPSGVEVKVAAGHDAPDFSLVLRKVAGRKRNTQSRDTGAAASAGHVMQPSKGVEMMTTAGASANGSAPAVASVRKNVAAKANN
jgi:hypothetical protein